MNNGLTGVASHEVFGRRNDCAFEWCTCKYGDLGREAGESHLNQRLALERKPDEAETQRTGTSQAFVSMTMPRTLRRKGEHSHLQP